METTSSQTKRHLHDLPQEVADGSGPDGGENSIGSLLYHLVVVELTHVEPAEDGLAKITVYRPRVADIEVYDAGGTILGGNAFLDDIDVGTVVLIAADENPVDPMYLSILRDDAFVLVGVVVRVATE